MSERLPLDGLPWEGNEIVVGDERVWVVGGGARERREEKERSGVTVVLL